MAITAEIFHDGPRSGSEDDQGIGSITVTYIVQTDSATDDMFSIAAAGVLPERFQAHDTDATFTVRKRSFQQSSEKATVWMVTLEYSNQTREETDDNPLQKPVVRSFSTAKVTKPVYRDTSGDAILNTATMPYNPPLERQASHGIYKFSRNEASFDDEAAFGYIDHVNSEAFLGKEPGYIRCNDISASNDFYQGAEYWKVDYEFEYNPDGWQPTVLSNGYLHLPDGETTPARIKDLNGEDVSEPAPLDDDGIVVWDAASTGQPAFQTFEIIPEANFSALNLG